jgi:1-aminocyclopropane-1-carboxylate deaminase
LYPEYLSIWEVLKAQTEISFDLLYDPLGWLSLLLALENGELKRESPIMYIHQGGVLGNETMLKRYKRNGLA